MRNLESLTLVKKGAKNIEKARLNKDTKIKVKANIIQLLRELWGKKKEKNLPKEKVLKTQPGHQIW